MTEKTLFNPDLKESLPLPLQDSWPESSHRFDTKSVWAVRAAIASGRPLLLRGEPGIGKSQIARAVAEELKVPFLYHVVDERSERDELLYTYDAVARLAEAQVSALSERRLTTSSPSTERNWSSFTVALQSAAFSHWPGFELQPVAVSLWKSELTHRNSLACHQTLELARQSLCHRPQHRFGSKRITDVCTSQRLRARHGPAVCGTTDSASQRSFLWEQCRSCCDGYRRGDF